MGSQVPIRFGVKRIAVIGAGPCGLAAAKYLIAQQAFDKVVIFEQRSDVGGVWNYSPNPSETLHVPQESADCAPDPPLRHPGGDAPVFASPMYDLLHTNIPRGLMPFSDLAFPENTLIFPSRQDVQDYLVQYAKDIRHLIQFSTQVKDIRLRQEGEAGKDQWDVDVVCLRTSKVSSATFDAVVVASGHYSTIYLPGVKGIAEFHKAHPHIITHSKHYRTPEPFAGKKVVVVGNAASGLDIAAQISPVCRKPLLLSVQTATSPAHLDWTGAEEVPVIDEFLVAERAVRFQDGRIEKDIDAVIFSTGYLYTYPFLRSLKPPVVTDGRRVRGLYKDLFRIDHPTLVFSGLPIKVVPLPTSETQAAVFSRTWANLLPLPSVEEMRKWEEEEVEKRGINFHVWPEGGDYQYINSVHDWIARSDTPGKKPPKWTPDQIWQRQIYAKAKLKFELDGRKAKTLEELGFEYVPGQESQLEIGHCLDILRAL
ncbi:Thiol-specific monooxygenase [Madurella mycetomatis]|uniref:Thiol-specific monooxygenase n=1 Tax=Madurella mycetomatis TaxID=100816 RepID=A0A175W1H9_9PEZI|nr:Thiol-specific monooxygenase [Madurella mycetomatis]